MLTLLMQLDSICDLDGMTECVMGAVRPGVFIIRGPQDEPVPEAEMQKNLRQQFIPRTLGSLAELGLLVG